jgi:hypothetical protein
MRTQFIGFIIIALALINLVVVWFKIQLSRDQRRNTARARAELRKGRR